MKLKVQKCPECGAEMYGLLFEEELFGICNAYFKCDCGWWIYFREFPIKEFVESEGE